MEITHESSMAEFYRLLKNWKPSSIVPRKPLRNDFYSIDGRSKVAVVRTNDRRKGIIQAIQLLGGIKPIIKGVQGEIIIKPNCNHDTPFPRNSHPETVRIIAESLIGAGVQPGRIVIGEMSGMYRGLPTCHTMENIGMKEVADDLGLHISCFEEEDWVTVDDSEGAWPNGVTIPRRIYEADRIIMTPILRPHTSATFSMSNKLAVGFMDAKSREWLHNGEAFYEKLLAFNLAFSTDFVVIDGLECYIDRGPDFTEMVKPGIIIAGSNRIATDSVAVAIMKQLNAYGMDKKSVSEHEQLKLGKKLGIGHPELDKIDLRTTNLTDDIKFNSLVTTIKNELKS